MNPLLDVDQRLLGEIYASRNVLDQLEVLCDDHGSRWGGSPQEEAAARYLRDTLAGYGWQAARLEPFSYVGWERGPATLRVISPIERTIPCISLPMCPPSQVEGNFVWVGDGSPDEFAAAADVLPGAVAGVGSRPPRGLNRTLHRSEKYQRTVLGGAAVFLYVNQYPGFGPETGSIANDREALIPGIGISFEDGELLRRWSRRHGELRLAVETTDQSGERTSWNVVADLPGCTRPDEWVVLGCHYDGHDVSQGAHDPASGAAAILEAARVLAAHAQDRLGTSLRVILFGIEETGLIGSRRYVQHHEAELDQVRFMFNMDAAGGPGEKGMIVNRWPELEPLVRRWEAEMETPVPVGQRTGAFSDHYPFFLAGVPTATMGDPNYVNTGRGFDHTQWDTVDKVQLRDLREAAAAAARLALRLSREEPWPLCRRDSEAVARLMEAEPNLEGQVVREAVDELYRQRDAGEAAG